MLTALVKSREVGGCPKTNTHYLCMAIYVVKVDLNSFRKAWDGVMLTLALQLATSGGVAMTIEDEVRGQSLDNGRTASD